MTLTELAFITKVASMNDDQLASFVLNLPDDEVGKLCLLLEELASMMTLKANENETIDQPTNRILH